MAIKEVLSLKSPLTVQWELTSNCNNRCTHCYNFWRQKDIKEDYKINKEQAIKIVENLGESEVFNLILTGGEPLIRKDILYNIISRANDYNMSTSINTNATLITKEDAEKIKSYNVKGVLTSLLSFDKEKHDKLTEHKGSFEKTINGIQNLLSAGISVSVNMVVMKENKNDVYETGKFLSGLGIKNFYATRLSPSFAEKNHIDKELNKEELITLLDNLLKVKKDFNVNVDTLEPIPHCLVSNVDKYDGLLTRKCSAAITWCAISSEGDVRSCTHFDNVYGNVLKEKISDIWLKMNDWRKGLFIPVMCKKCAGVDICGAGCRAAALAHGNLNDPDPWCTSPENFVPRKQKIMKLEDDKIYKIRNGIKFRKEVFGFAVYGSPSAIAYINEDGLELLKRIRKLGKFTLTDMKNIDVDMSFTMRFLLKLKYKNLLIEDN